MVQPEFLTGAYKTSVKVRVGTSLQVVFTEQNS